MASFTAGETMTKLLAGQLPVGEIILIRGMVATAIIVAICLRQDVLIHAAQAFKRTILARSLSDMAALLREMKVIDSARMQSP